MRFLHRIASRMVTTPPEQTGARRRSARIAAATKGSKAAATSQSEDGRSSSGKRFRESSSPKPEKPVLEGTKSKKLKVEHGSGPTFEVEQSLIDQGFKHVAGVDEAGRGPLAGPVVAAACILPPGFVAQGIDDSKKISEAKREELYETITSDENVIFASCIVDHEEIGRINILQAALSAMVGAVNNLSMVPDYILIDGNIRPSGFDAEKSRTIVKGDGKCLSIAAASIIAKVERDRLMKEYDSKWPQYGFAKHKGYATSQHTKAIVEHGPCPIHRTSWSTFAKYAPKQDDK